MIHKGNDAEGNPLTSCKHRRMVWQKFNKRRRLGRKGKIYGRGMKHENDQKGL